jgi:hypothetical protein
MRPVLLIGPVAFSLSRAVTRFQRRMVANGLLLPSGFFSMRHSTVPSYTLLKPDRVCDDARSSFRPLP